MESYHEDGIIPWAWNHTMESYLANLIPWYYTIPFIPYHGMATSAIGSFGFQRFYNLGNLEKA